MATYQSKFTGAEIDAKLDQVGQVASADTLGGIKVGEGLEITEDGILSALGGGGSSSGGSTLPSEYQEVEYIQSTGTQYIDTGVTPNSDTGFDIKFSTTSPLQDTPGFGMIFAARHDGTKDFFLSTYSPTTQSVKNGTFCYGTGTANAIAGGFSANTVSNINFRNGVYIKNDRTEVNIGVRDVVTNCTLTLFASHYSTNETSQFSSVKLYSFNLYEGNTLIRRFIPCYRKSDGEIGLYDLVNNVFYVNNGTGTLLKGFDIVVGLELGGGGSSSTREYGMFYYKQTGTNSSKTELFPTETDPEGYLGVGLTNMELDEQGRPILKKGKTYKFTVITGEIYFSSTSGYYYATVALNENYRVLTATIIPTTYGTINNNNNTSPRRETGLAKIEEDAALKVYDGWGSASSGIKSADFYVLVEEVSASGGGSSSGAKKVTLWEGELSTEETSVTLSDSVENYDFVLVEGCIDGKTSGNKGAIETKLIDTSTITYTGSLSVSDFVYSIYATTGDASKNIYYRLLFNFVDSTTLALHISKLNGTAWTNQRITKVTGIKL